MFNHGQHWFRAHLALFFVALAVALATTPASAKPGRPDWSFGANGKVTTGFEQTVLPSASMTIGSRGKILVAGSLEGEGLALARYLSNGKLDSSFGSDGIALIDPGSRIAPGAVTLDHRGRIVIGGVAEQGFAIARLHPDGAPDKSFSGDGFKYTKITRLGEIEAIAIDGRNRIVAAGYTASTTRYHELRYTVARYRPDGDLDRRFAGNGIYRRRFGRLPGGAATSVAIDHRGRIVVGGRSVDGQPTPHRRVTRFAVARLNSDGRPDRSFGGNGKVRTKVGSSASIVDIEIDRRGRIVAAGNSRDATVVRYLPNGSLDKSFSGNGKAVIEVSLGTRALAIDRRGRILLGGNVGGGDEIAWAVTRLHANGAKDERFGGLGALQTQGWSSVSDLAVDRRGRLTAVGVFRSQGPEPDEGFALERYQSD